MARSAELILAALAHTPMAAEPWAPDDYVFTRVDFRYIRRADEFYYGMAFSDPVAEHQEALKMLRGAAPLNEHGSPVD